MWQGKVDDRCISCNGFVEPQRFSREVEKQVNRDLRKEGDYLFVKPGDSPDKRAVKESLNVIRWFAYYAQIAFFLFVTMILVILSLFAA
jgi:hypothetical protein